MKIKKSEPLSWLCIGAVLFFMAGLVFFEFGLIIRSILIVLIFASLLGIVIFSKRKEQLYDVKDIDTQIQEQEEIITENINKIKNAQQDFWKEKRNENIEYDDERLNQLKQIKQKYFVISTPTKILGSEYLDLTKEKSPFEQQILKKGINNQGYLDLTLPEHQSEETIKHKIDKMLKNKQIKVKSQQTKKDENEGSNVFHLETRNSPKEANTTELKIVDVDNQSVDIQKENKLKVRELKNKKGTIQKIVTIPKMEETKTWKNEDFVELKKVKVSYEEEK